MTLASIILFAVETAGHTSEYSGMSLAQFGYICAGIVSCLSIIAGLFFVFAGTVGVLRLPDFYTRLHAAGMTDTLGVELVLLGLILQAGFSLISLKLLMVAFFLLLTSPTATHAVAHAAYNAGLKPKLGKFKVKTEAELLAKPEDNP